MLVMPSARNRPAASSAFSGSSPGMKRRTARFANQSFGRRSRSHALRAIQSSSLRMLQRLPRPGAPGGGRLSAIGGPLGRCRRAGCGVRNRWAARPYLTGDDARLRRDPSRERIDGRHRGPGGPLLGRPDPALARTTSRSAATGCRPRSSAPSGCSRRGRGGRERDARAAHRGAARPDRRRRRRGRSTATLADEFPLRVWQTGLGHADEHERQRGASRTAPTSSLGGARRQGRRSTRTTTSTEPVVERHVPDGACTSPSRWRSSEQLLPAPSGRCATRSTTKAAAFADIVKIGRTHLQDATPLTLGQEISRLGRPARPRHRARSSATLPAAVRARARRDRGRHRAQRATREFARARRRARSPSSPACRS